MKTLQIFAVVSMLALPLLQGLTFLLHYESFGGFFDFSLSKPPYTTDQEWAKISDPARGWRYFFMPHYLAYFILPFYLGIAATIARAIWAKAPLLAVIGSITTAIGLIYMGGVFGAWLSFGAVTNLAPEAGMSAFLALTEMKGALMITSVLSLLAILGLAILGTGLIITRAVPLWAGLCFLIGNILIVVMMDRDNWMFVGTLLMLAGLSPLIRHIHQDHLSRSQK